FASLVGQRAVENANVPATSHPRRVVPTENSDSANEGIGSRHDGARADLASGDAPRTAAVERRAARFGTIIARSHASIGGRTVGAHIMRDKPIVGELDRRNSHRGETSGHRPCTPVRDVVYEHIRRTPGGVVRL